MKRFGLFIATLLMLAVLFSCDQLLGSTKFTITLTQSAGGTITLDPVKESYANGDTVKVTAAADAGFVFGSWTSGLTGTDNPGTLTISANTTISATFTAKVADPTFSVAAGTYTEPKKLELASVTAGAAIRYTLDGSEPSSTAGTLYEAPITVDANLTVKAIAYKADLVNSAIVSADYVITLGSANMTVTNPWTPTITFAGNQSSINVGTTMTVTATVDPTPDSYAWYFDATELVGQTTNTLAIPNTVAAGTHVVTLMVKKDKSFASERFTFTAVVLAPGTIAGTVKDAVSNSGIASVSVTASSGTTTVATTTSDATGAYSLSVPANATVQVQFAKTGFMSATYTGVSAESATTTYLETILQIASTYTGTGVVSGTINDAFTGLGVSGVAVNLRSGLGTTTGTTSNTTTTDSSGNYSFAAVATGYYTAEISKTGYTTAFFSVFALGGLTRPNQNATISPVLPSGQIRFVLTWGASPSDLDSHMKTPVATYNHVSYLAKGNSTASPWAALDVDDTSSYGPETITIYTAQTGDYTYYVHDFSNRTSTTSNALGASGAQVKVYTGSLLKATYNVPAGAGTLWKVCTLSGTTLTPINTMLYEADPGTVSTRYTTRDNVSEDELSMFRNLPAK